MVKSELPVKVLFEYAGRIAAIRDRGLLVEELAGLARDLTGADRCTLWLADRQKEVLWTKVAQGVDALEIGLKQGLAGACVESGETVLVNDTRKDARFAGAVDRSSGYETRNVLVVPMRDGRGEVMGCCQLLNKEGGFAEGDESLAGLAASYAASVIDGQRAQEEAEEARRIERDLEIARGVQRSLLPRSAPEMDGIRMAAFFQPASQVGGDYYVWRLEQTGRLFFALGDVSGKGIAAALLMATIQAALSDPRGSLTERAGRLNGFVLERSAPGRYTTMVLGEYDPVARRFELVCAGHVPPALIRGGAVSLLEEGSLPVGLVRGAQYSSFTVDAQPGDRLLVISDGVSEAEGAGEEMFGAQRAGEVLAGEPDLERGVARVVEVALEFAGGEQADDATVVALEVTG